MLSPDRSGLGDRRPRLLAVSPVPAWPVENGYALRVARLLPGLCERWQVVLAAPLSAGAERAEIPDWGLVRLVPLEPLARWTFLPWQYETAPVRAAVARLIGEWRPHAALLFGGAEYLAFGDPGFPPAVADHVDCVSLGCLGEARRARDPRERVGLLREAARAAAYERRVVRRMRATVVVGERDARWMRRLGGRGRVEVLPNGVEASAEAAWDQAAPDPTVIFSGVLDYPPNADAARWLARAIWPLVLRRVPAARLRIVGRRPGPELRALARPSIAVVGDVPDLPTELRGAWVAVAPMRIGGGIKNKVLEAWAAGRPVVMSGLAANGLDPPRELGALVAEGADAIAARLVRILTDIGERRALGEAALAHARERHVWPDVAERLSALLLEAAAERASAAAPGPGDRAAADASIGFAVVTRNRPAYLRDCLASIDASARAAGLGGRVPVAVLDNSDADGTRGAVEELAPRLPALALRYARTPPSTDVLAAGRNTCVAALGTPLVAFVDDDTVLARTWLAACLAAFEDAGVAAVTGRIVEPGTEALDPDADLPIGRILSDGRMSACFYLRRAEPVAVEHVRGCNWACRRDAFEAVGGFATAFEHVFEEADLSLRLTRSGRRILFVPGVEVEHRCGPRAHPLRRGDPARALASARAELAFYTLLLVRNFGATSPTLWRFLLTRETGLRGLARAPSRAALREVLNRAAGKALGLARSLRRSPRRAPLAVRFDALGGA